jgi:hypothetical protein
VACSASRASAWEPASCSTSRSARRSSRSTRRCHRVADWLGLLSPRLSGGLRSETRDAARTLDEAVLEARVLELVTAGALDLDAARTAYAANTTMRRAASDLARLDREL